MCSESCGWWGHMREWSAPVSCDWVCACVRVKENISPVSYETQVNAAIADAFWYHFLTAGRYLASVRHQLAGSIHFISHFDHIGVSVANSCPAGLKRWRLYLWLKSKDSEPFWFVWLFLWKRDKRNNLFDVVVAKKTPKQNATTLKPNNLKWEAISCIRHLEHSHTARQVQSTRVEACWCALVKIVEVFMPTEEEQGGHEEAKQQLSVISETQTGSQIG